MQPRLNRSRTDRMIAGVCGGLGLYFGVDPVIVRLIFVVLAITTFITPLIYPILWLIMPESGTLPGSSAGSATSMPLPTDARFDPMTGQPLPQAPYQQAAATYTPPAAQEQSSAPSGRNRTLGFLLAGFGAIILFSEVSEALGRLFNFDVGSIIFPVILVGAGLFLLRRKTT